MATDFTQDAVLVFLQRCGGSAKNTELLAHFLPYLRDNPDNVGNRDLFKSFVNSVATVSKIDGVSTVILRKKYRGYVSGEGSGRNSAEPGPDGASLSPAVSLAPPGDTERNPALPAAGIVVESGARLKYRENPSPEPVQVRNRVPELSEIPYQSKTEEQIRLISAPGAPAVRHQDYIPEPIRWQEMPQESFIPAPTRRQEAPHQDRFPEPIRGQDYEPIGGHIVSHQDYTPRPTGRYEVPQQDFPHLPSRRVDKPHQGTVPEPVRGHIVGRQDHAPDPGERWDPPNQGTVSEPNKGRIVSRQDHAPEPIKGQKTSHQKRISEPFRGHVGNRQDHFPGPVRGQQVLHQSPFPAPNRRWDALHQDPRGFVISRVPEPNRGQNAFYQDPSRDPLRSSQPPTSQPPRGQQSFYQIPQNPEHLRGWEIPYQDPIPEYLSGQQVPQNLEPLRGQRIPYQIPQNPEPLRGQRIPYQVPQNPEPLRGQWIPHQVPQTPEHFRGQEIYYEDPVPEAFRGQNVYYQKPIPEYLSGHQIPQNIELRRGQQVPQNPEPLRVQRVPQQIPEHFRGQEIPYEDPVPEPFRGQNVYYQEPIPEYLSGHQALQNLEPLRGQQVSYDPVPEHIRGQKIYFPDSNPDLHREQKIPYQDPIPEYLGDQQIPQNPEQLLTAGPPEPERNIEPLRRQQVHQNLEPPNGKEVPQNPDLRRVHQKNPEPLQRQPVPQSPEPLKGQWNPKSPELHRVHERNAEPLQGQPVPQNLEPLHGQPVPQNLEPLQRQPVPQSREPLKSPELHRVHENNSEPLQGQQVPQNLELLKGQPVPKNLEPLKGQPVPQSPELHRVHQKIPEPLKGQQVPKNLEPLHRNQIPQGVKPAKGQQVNQSLEPHKGQHISQSPELRKVHQKNLEPPKEQQIPQNLEPLKGQQVPKSPDLRRQQKISFLDLVPESDPGQQSPPQDPEPVGGPEPVPQLHQAPARRFRHRQSYRSAVSEDDDKEEEDVQIRRGSAGGQWPLNAPLSDVARAMSASSPCVIEAPAPPSSSSGNKVPQIYIQKSDIEVLASRSHSESGSRPEPGPVPVESMRRSLPLEAEFNAERLHDKRAARSSEPVGPHQNQRLSSSQSDIFDPPSDVRSSVSDWPPPGSSRTRLGSGADEPAGLSTSLEVLQESNGTKLEPLARRSVLKMSFHQSMGNLCDDVSPPSGKLPLYLSSDHLNDNLQYASRGSSLNQSTDELYDDMKSSKSSIDSPQVKLRSAAARRMSSRLGNRISRSLGNDLDQEEAGGGLKDPRLERQHRISSSLSLPHHLSSSSLSSCTTPPRCPSPIASEGRRKESKKSLHSHNAGKSGIPLEALEHDWMVKAAAGAWPDIYTLFRSDSSLLNRQDFICGFTVLHWMAKHGDHRVINTLSYGVEQKGLSFDVNAKSTAGQTALHVAAMHGHKNIIRLLVKKFKADVKLRDMAGKKAWQYLSDRSPDMLELLAVPPKAALTHGVENAEPDSKPPKQQQRRRLHHHFSSASSGQRPQTLAGLVKVNRSSSIAAMLKPKSLQRFSKPEPVC
ncbi:titin-like [Gambusia affinis]|uniref:titin-like n=1 Tax=Gambusia affinis TaxID=33528 RepID=UPI001CDCA897|nr:titin-like [Gambusia affinis]